METSKTDVERIEAALEAWAQGLESLKFNATGNVHAQIELLNQSAQVSGLYFVALQLAKLNEKADRLLFERLMS